MTEETAYQHAHIRARIEKRIKDAFAPGKKLTYKQLHSTVMLEVQAMEAEGLLEPPAPPVVRVFQDENDPHKLNVIIEDKA